MIAQDLVQVLMDASLRGGAALLFAGIVVLALRRRSGAVRHAVWMAGLGALIVAPLAIGLLPRLPLPVLPATTVSSVVPLTTEVQSVEGTEATAIETRHTDRAQANPWVTLAGIWMIGASWMMLRTLRAHRRVARILRAAEPVLDPRVVAAWSRARANAGVPAGVNCRISRHVAIPLACGIVRPQVLLPTVASDWSDATLHAVLEHELTHLRRRDPLVLAIAQVTRAVYWFHPLVWLAVRELRAESERACDDAVLRAGARPSRYAETLLSFVGEPAPESAAALAFLRLRGLERRIDGILTARYDRRALGRGQRIGIGVATLMAVLLLATVQPVPGRASRTAQPAPPATPATPRAEGQSADSDAWLTRAKSAKLVTARFRNRVGVPVRIRQAQVRAVDNAQGSGTRGITMPELVLENLDTQRRVVAVEVSSELPTTRDRWWVEVPIPAQRTATVKVESSHWSAVVPTDDADELLIRLTGVRFEGEGGELPGWAPTPEAAPQPEPAPGITELPPPGAAPPAPRPEGVTPLPGVAPKTPKAPKAPSPGSGIRVRIEELPNPNEKPGPAPGAPSAQPKPAPRPDESGWVKATFRNPDNAPVVIVHALTAPGVIKDGEALTQLPEVVIENRSDRWVTSLRLRYKADAPSHAVSGYSVSIRPHGSVLIHREDYEIAGKPENMTVQILGAQFEDGTVWGTLDSKIDGRDAWVYPLSPH